MSHDPCIDPSDRGLAFGDGLFETILCCAGRLLWWPDHWARLSEGCRALGLPQPDETAVLARIGAEIDSMADAGRVDREHVVKLIYTAGPGQRGYRRPQTIRPTLLVRVASLPSERVDLRRDGVDLGVAQAPLMVGFESLRGLKHLNRLPQVLARAEWSDAEASCGHGHFDRLQFDTGGRVVGCTAGNFFWLENGRWHTPPVTGSAIAGTVRARLIHHLPARITPLARGRLAVAESALITNAVWGALPVRQLAGRPIDPVPAGRVMAEHDEWQRQHGLDRRANPYTAWMTTWYSEMQRP